MKNFYELLKPLSNIDKQIIYREIAEFIQEEIINDTCGCLGNYNHENLFLKIKLEGINFI